MKRVTVREDPTTRIAHYGHIVGTWETDQAWVRLCKSRASCIDTVFWMPCLDNEVTCLWCVLKEFT